MNKIEFFYEDTDFKLEEHTPLIDWLIQVAHRYNSEISSINYIYCSDNYLVKINKEYLDHDYYTDIITFDQRDQKEEAIEADIFISVDRIKENARSQSLKFEEELHRVTVHGLLHLIGFNDKTPTEELEMRKTEDTCLSLLHN